MAHGAQAFVRNQFPDGFKGYACDVGANDGEFESNTDQLESEGWTVLCVEPNPLLKMVGSSRRKLWRSVAAWNKDEIRTFMSIGGWPYASGSRIDGDVGTICEVQTLRLDRILEEAGFPRLDFLTVDVEGWEEVVMQGFTRSIWKPQVISLEHYPHAHIPNIKTADTALPMYLPGYDAVTAFLHDVMYVRQS